MVADTGPKKDFFISYTGADVAWAEWVAWVLEDAQYTVLIQKWDFHFGDNFVANMHKALENSERTIAILSEAYLASTFCRAEWTAAFAKSTPDTPRLLPIRIANIEWPGLFAPIASLDLFDIDEVAAKDHVLAAVKKARAKTSAAPPFPVAATKPSQPAPNFPGALPAIWNLTRRNPNFIGRAAPLNALRASFKGGSAAAVTQAAGITGMGGIGKSQLAIEYAYRYRADYDLAWWLRAEEPGTLAADFDALSSKLGLPEKDAQDQAVVVAAVLEWLERHSRWLLIFDNAQKPHALKDLLPRGESGDVIITSRNPNFGGLVKVLPLDLWPRSESIAFLEQRSGSGGADAEALADALGDLPLALEQAAAYCQTTGESVAGYTRMLTAGYAAELFAKPLDAERTVAAVWDLAFARVAQESPAGAALLKLLSFLAPDAIPLDVISGGAEQVPEPLRTAVVHPVQRNEALAALLRYSLIRRDGDCLYVHRLVQAVTRQRMADEEHKAWAAAAVTVIDDAVPAFPYDAFDAGVAATYDRVGAHALAAAEHAAAANVAPEAAGSLFLKIGFYRNLRADFESAGMAHERAFAIAKAAFGLNHKNVGTCLNNLATVRLEEGKVYEASVACDDAIKIVIAAVGPNHEEVATCLSVLASVLLQQDDLAGAWDVCTRALAIDEEALGPNHPNLARDLNNFGIVQRQMGILASAKQAHERALAIVERHFGGDHPIVAGYLSNLGLVLHAQGDLTDAKRAHERAVDIDTRAFGPDHPNVAIDINNLGWTREALGDRAGAEADYARAFSICKRSFGAEHPRTRIAHANLARVSGA